MAGQRRDRIFEEEDWELLISDIEQHNVVPVVGQDLLIAGSDASQTLYQHVVGALVDQLGIDPAALPSPCSLIDLCGYVDSRARQTQDIIRMAIRTWPVPEPLRQLAEIEGFDFYVSTTFDSLLHRALQQTRGSADARIYGLKRRSADADIPSDKLSVPVVFQIFGLMDGTADCALSEEQVLEFTQRLQDPSYRPPRVFDLLARRNLLVLGCGFPGWLGRFFRRVLKGSGDLRDQGLFAHSAFAKSDPGYVLFLERQGAKLWLNDTGVGFVSELHRRWRMKHPVGETADVFISYAKEDVNDALELSDLFKQQGVGVWFDRSDLRSGEIWRKEIEEAIAGCRVFVPLISRNTARAAQDRFVHKEWEYVSNMGNKKICPLRLDFTEAPKSFDEYQTRTFQERQDLIRDVRGILGRQA